jgi:hypothetical protein
VYCCVDHCCLFVLFSLGHCIVHPSANYGIRLLLASSKLFIQLHKSFSSLKPLKLSCTYVSESMCIIQIMLLINRTHIVQLDITIESHVNLILTDETDTACEIMSVSLGQTVKEND